MSLYTNYISEIENRKKEGLKPKPIEDGSLLKEIISQIKDENNIHRTDSLNFLIYNTIPGTTTAAVVKSKFLKEIITKQIVVKEIEPKFAFELLSHMKGGQSFKFFLDLALGKIKLLVLKEPEFFKTKFFLNKLKTLN